MAAVERADVTVAAWSNKTSSGDRPVACPEWGPAAEISRIRFDRRIVCFWIIARTICRIKPEANGVFEGRRKWWNSLPRRSDGGRMIDEKMDRGRRGAHREDGLSGGREKRIEKWNRRQKELTRIADENGWQWKAALIWQRNRSSSKRWQKICHG